MIQQHSVSNLFHYIDAKFGAVPKEHTQEGTHTCAHTHKTLETVCF